MSVMANKGAACGCCSPQATSTGARVFGAMKGASDGGIFYPALRAAFPGSKELDAETLQSYIYGAHVEDEERFRKQFAKFLEDDVSSEDIEDMFREAHEKIREDPTYTKTDKADLAKWKEASKKTHPKKLSVAECRARTEQKKQEFYASKE
ncbi:60S ribosomal protein L5 [Rhodotorula mucilaginosa]|uniref:60S ribosomal protein L5 n=1 Tax=Rhodotorula mucilaginosa TaxID=5537 RepID=A0A9P6W106_RHOMI|nr:60S ribosomal protein L5 [Rhodotorula mucilaginosa]